MSNEITKVLTIELDAEVVGGDCTLKVSEVSIGSGGEAVFG
jgi:hypothetical protein